MLPWLLAIDIETSGLNPLKNQVLELGMVAWNGEEKRVLNWFVDWKFITWEVETFKFLGSANVERLMVGEPRIKFFTLKKEIEKWLGKLDLNNIVVVGKNFGKFDWWFLKNLEIELPFRYLDIGSICFDPVFDKSIPNLLECKRRAGISGEVKHTALDDCEDYLRIVKWKYNLKGEI